MRIAVHNHALRIHDNELLRLGPGVKHVYLRKRVGGAKQWWLARSLKAHALNLAAMGIELHIVDALPANRQLNVNQHPSVNQFEALTVVYDNGYLLANGHDRSSLAAFVRSSMQGDATIYSPAQFETRHLLRLPLKPIEDVAWPVPTQFAMWRPGEQGAHERLHAWNHRVSAKEYGAYRGYPSTDVTSRLSPHIAEGEITPRQIRGVVGHAHPILHELHWREYKHHLARHLDYTTEINKAFSSWQWTNNAADIRAWKFGNTGVPLVDAGMRELWFTGFMDNRVRMIVASYLVKILNVDWRIGAAWFSETLLDADEAINNTQWQSALGCGINEKAYPVIMNPYTQHKKFDAADYIARWNVSIVNEEYTAPPFEEARKAAQRRFALTQ